LFGLGVRRLVLSVVLAMAAGTPVAWGTAAAGPDAVDKTEFTLFNPTPRERMREMNTDRPDKTESPFTVDAGHFQVEADILNYAYDRYNPDRSDTRVETVSIAPVNLKVGLLNNVDLQLLLESYVSQRTHDVSAGVVRNHRGIGDVLVRLKWNAWGNDGGATALGLIPYVRFPTAGDDSGGVEGGMILPVTAGLPAGLSLATMTELDLRHDSTGDGRHLEFLHSISFGHDIAGRLAGYLEFFSAVSMESGADWVGTVDVGLTYALTNDIQLDCGVNLGVTRAADDLNPFVGISWRF
jgi:hypothetical protein